MLCVLCAACAAGDKGASASREVCAGKVTLPTADSFVYRAKNDAFKVVLPHAIGADHSDKETPNTIFMGDGVFVYYASERDLSLPFEFLFPQLMIDRMRAGGADGVKGTVTHELPLTCSGHPGRESVIAARDNTVICRMRIFLVGTHAYTLTATTSVRSAQSPRLSAFLDSFRPLRGR